MGKLKEHNRFVLETDNSKITQQTNQFAIEFNSATGPLNTRHLFMIKDFLSGPAILIETAVLPTNILTLEILNKASCVIGCVAQWYTSFVPFC